MYVTRRLSVYQKDPSALSLPPPDGPDTGILVIQDVEKELNKPCCFGMCIGHSLYYINDLPLPQNTQLRKSIKFSSDHRDFRNFMAIPVINKPLSTGLYYILDSDRCSGCAYTSNGTKGEYKSCFCFKRIKEAGLRPLHPSNKYQHFYIRRGSEGMEFKSFASDGHVPRFFKDTYGTVFSRLDYYDFQLDDVSGLDHSLRKCLPKFDFPLSQETSDAVIVGKWYCPFMFVKEQNLSLATQMKISMFYEMTLKQQWVRIFSCSNGKDVITRDSFVSGVNVETEVVDMTLKQQWKEQWVSIFSCSSEVVGGDSVVVDVNVETEAVDVVGMKICENTKVIDGVKWFEGLDKEGGAAKSVGLNRVIIDKIIRDQESFGWVRCKAKVKRVEKFKGKGRKWKKFGCYVLLEKYVLRRGDKILEGCELRRGDKDLVLTYEFWHTQHIRCKWE